MITVLVLLAFSVFVGLLSELYKKVIRKDTATEWEIKMVAFAFSVIFGCLSFLVLGEDALPDGVIYTPFVIVLFSVLIYLFQLPACQAVWKPLVKKLLERKVNNA